MESKLISRGVKHKRSAIIGMFVGALMLTPLSVNAAGHSVAGKFGVAIPETTVNIGLCPFGDHTLLAAGMAHGYFEDVGINVGPEKFSSVAYNQILPLLLKGDYDVTTDYYPGALQSLANTDEKQQFTFSDTYVGLYFMAAPGTGYKTVPDLVDQGVPFNDAIKEVMAQFKGKRVAVDDTGSHRGFIDAIFDLGGITPDDLGEFLFVDDATMLLMGRGGKVDFVKTLGGAQSAELVLDGWYIMVGVEDLIAGLPAGDPRGVLGIGHTGLSTTKEYYAANRDTILRVAGVMFRSIDAVQKDLAEGTTDNALGAILPVLESNAAVEIGIPGLKIIYEVIDPFKNFEEQAEYWLEADNPFYYANVYNPQLKTMQDGGVVSEDKTVDDATLGPEVYRALVAYRLRYDMLLGHAGSLTGDAAALAEEAAAHYANRNYLDAYRFLAAAIKG